MLGRQRFSSALRLGASGQPNSANSILLATRNIGIQLVTDEQHLISGQPASRQGKIKEPGPGLSKPGVHGGDDPCKEPPDPSSVKKAAKLGPGSCTRVRPDCRRN